MNSLRLLLTVAVSASLAFAVAAPIARADPTAPAATPKPKKRSGAAKPASGTQKPKAAATPKDAPAEAAKPPSGGASAAHEVVEHESRIEFDERMVRGQSAAGAIFLFQRTPTDLKSIVEVPDSFRAKTVEMLQPERGTP